MIRLITENLKVSIVGNDLVVPFKDRNSIIEQLAKLKGKVSVEIKQYRKPRSVDANNLCWVLCDKIAKVIGSTKELVYQQTVLRVGVFEIIPIKEKLVERHNERWNSIGLGWFTVDDGTSKLDGFRRIFRYYGSSTYDTLEMSKLINELVFEAKELDIEILSKEEIENIKAEWGKQ